MSIHEHWYHAHKLLHLRLELCSNLCFSPSVSLAVSYLMSTTHVFFCLHLFSSVSASCVQAKYNSSPLVKPSTRANFPAIDQGGPVCNLGATQGGLDGEGEQK